MSIIAGWNPENLYDCSRPIAFEFHGLATDVNMVYKIRATDNWMTANWIEVSGVMRQPKELDSLTLFRLDPSQICQDFIRTSIRGTGAIRAEQMLLNARVFSIIWTEEYYDQDGVLVYNDYEPSWHQSGYFYGIDAAIQHEQTYGLAVWDYIKKCLCVTFGDQAEARENEFLTNRPKNLITCKSSNIFLDYIDHRGNIAIKATLKRENPLTAWVTYDIYPGPKGRGGYYSAAIGYQNIIDLLDANGDLGPPYWSASDDIVGVKIAMYDATFGGRISGYYNYDFDDRGCDCNHRNITLHWKNRKGGINSWTFKGNYGIKQESSFQTFRRALGFRRTTSENTQDGTFYDYATFNQQSLGTGKINIKANEKIDITSGHLTREEAQWLSEVATAPRVWVENSAFSGINNNDGMQSCYVVSEDQIIKDDDKGIVQIDVSIRLSNPVYTQRQ